MLSSARKIVFCLCTLIWSWGSHASSPVQNYAIDLEQHDIEIRDDLTYSREVTLHYTILTPVGAEILQKYRHSYYSENETFTVLQASITSPDGKVFPVEQDNIYEQDLGGRDQQRRSRESVVIFSQLTPGSRMSLKYRHEVSKKGPMGLNLFFAPSFGVKQKSIRANILLPAKTHLKWGSRGGFTVASKPQADRQLLQISLNDIPYMETEMNMVSPNDVLPLFAVTSLQSWEQIGRIYHDNSLDRQANTPEIRELAWKITGDSDSPIVIAKKIYTWVAQNINYLSVSFNLEDNLVPHKVEEIIQHGYGDCKDQALLMQTLLKVRGIDSVPALTSWSDSYKDWPVPTPMQFNHALLYIPQLNVYLNPVTPLYPFGQLDEELANKRVVLATREGQTMMLPVQKPSANSYRVENHMVLAQDGSLTGETTVSGTGSVGLQIRELLASPGSGERKANNILSGTVAGGFGGLTQAMSPYDLDTVAQYSGQWHSPKAFSLARYGFITTTAGLDFKDALALRTFLVDGGRRFPLSVGPRDYQWQHSIQLPEKYRLAFKPENLKLSNRAGDYTSEYTLKGKTLHIFRHIVIKKYVYSASEYPEFEQLAYAAINDSRAVIGLKKENNFRAQDRGWPVP